MSNLTRAMMMGAAGAASGPTYVDDVFSTDLWTGNDTARNITSGLDMTGEGGMVWIKRRNGSTNPMIWDTERGTYHLETDGTGGQSQFSNFFTGFRNDGFSIGTSGNINGSGTDAVGWSFRKAPGFFDVVTWTGTDGSATRVLNHSLDSVPGMVICKSFSNSGTQWYIYHKELGLDRYLSFNTGSANTSTGAWNSVTSTTFGLGTAANLNAAGREHVAYLFADNEPMFGTGGDESIIKCGQYIGDGSSTGTLQNLGFEPQWLLIKNITRSESWLIFDNMRGVITGGVDKSLEPQASASEQTQELIQFESTGFRPMGSDAKSNKNGDYFIYMAIRRPNKPPTAATEVFAIDTMGGTSPTPPTFNSGFITDLAIQRSISGSSNNFISRLTGPGYLTSNTTNEEGSGSQFVWDYMDGWRNYTSTDANTYSWMFKRAPGFMDVVTWTGNGSSTQNVTHNFGVTPELILSKARDSTQNWLCSTSISGLGGTLFLNTDDSLQGYWRVYPTSSTQISAYNLSNHGVPSANASNVDHIAYLFATLPGISKVGSYSGTGNAVNVDCGFTNGARFVLIKRTDAANGDWFVWDTSRGISSGNDPYFYLNQSGAQNGNYDHIDPLTSGFTVTASAPVGLNASGGTYLFLAIA